MAELPDSVRDLLTRANSAHVATVLPSGAPHSVPVWIALEGERIASSPSRAREGAQRRTV